MNDEESRPNYYAIIPASVRYDKSITANAKLLYGELTALCNKHGYCWATNNYFADLYGVRSMSITNWLKQLSNAGVVVINVDKKAGNRRKIWLADPHQNILGRSPKNFGGDLKGTGNSTRPSTHTSQDFVNSGKARKPKDVAEVIAYAKTRGLPTSDAEGFFDSQESGGWTRGGRPIVDWQAAFRTWQINGWLPSQKKQAARSRRWQPEKGDPDALKYPKETYD